VSAFNDRHGKRRYYYERTGEKKVYLKEHPGTPKHPSAEYKALLTGQRAANDVKPVEARTIRDLVNRYYSTPKYLSPGAVTQEKVRARLEDFCASYGKLKVAGLKFNHVETILAKKAQVGRNAAGKKVGGPNAAKSLEKDLVRILDLAVKLEWIPTNPARLAEGVKVPKTNGFHTWTEEEIEQYQSHYPLGTMGRLAIEIILWTLLRRGDASQFGPKHRKGGMIHVWNEKTKKWSWLPEPPQLTAAIEAMTVVGTNVYLLSESGPFASPASFGMWFRRRCDEAGLPHCSAHGLRKATARRAAELGGTQQELKAAGNWSQDKDVAIYTAAADQKRLAKGVMTRVAEQHPGPEG
jgi:integrase